MGIVGILGILGFGLALCLAYLEWKHYHVPLQLRLREIRIAASSEDTYLVLLRLSTVNQSLKGVTVYDIDLKDKPSNAIVTQCHNYQYDETNHDTLIYELPNDRNVNAPIRSDELLWLPLDIPPHQSRSGWLVFVVKVEQQKELKKGIHLHFIALDASVPQKTLAECQKTIELKTYMPR